MRLVVSYQPKVRLHVNTGLLIKYHSRGDTSVSSTAKNCNKNTKNIFVKTNYLQWPFSIEIYVDATAVGKNWFLREYFFKLLYRVTVATNTISKKTWTMAIGAHDAIGNSQPQLR